MLLMEPQLHPRSSPWLGGDKGEVAQRVAEQRVQDASPPDRTIGMENGSATAANFDAGST